MPALTVTTLAGIPMVRPGDSLATIIGTALEANEVRLRDGDIVVVPDDGTMIDAAGLVLHRILHAEVDADLGQGSFRQCHACRHPLSAADLEHPDYETGVSCPHCAGSRDDAGRAALRERQRQVDLAAARGDLHVGKVMGGELQK